MSLFECSRNYFCAYFSLESPFCCNVKGLRYAVFNRQLPKEEYLRVKKMLLDYVNAELSKKKKLEQTVFNLAGAKK